MDVFPIDKLMSHNLLTGCTSSTVRAQIECGFRGVHVQWRPERQHLDSHEHDQPLLCSQRATQPHRRSGRSAGVAAYQDWRRGFHSVLRQRQLREAAGSPRWNRGFICSSPLCTLERNDSREIRDRRRELLAKFKDFTPDPDQFVKHQDAAFRIHAELVDTYSQQLYEYVPRTNLINKDEQFVNLWFLIKPAKETYELIKDMLRDMG